VTLIKFTNLIEERSASVFRVEQVKEAIRKLLIGYLLSLLFDPEGGDIAFLRNIDELLPDHTVLHPTRCYLSL
jgi:hypothetical protein